jgi:hypothetical protein
MKIGAQGRALLITGIREFTAFDGGDARPAGITSGGEDADAS